MGFIVWRPGYCLKNYLKLGNKAKRLQQVTLKWYLEDCLPGHRGSPDLLRWGISELCPIGQIKPNTCFMSLSLLGMQPCSSLTYFLFGRKGNRVTVSCLVGHHPTAAWAVPFCTLFHHVCICVPACSSFSRPLWTSLTCAHHVFVWESFIIHRKLYKDLLRPICASSQPFHPAAVKPLAT